MCTTFRHSSWDSTVILRSFEFILYFIFFILNVDKNEFVARITVKANQFKNKNCMEQWMPINWPNKNNLWFLFWIFVVVFSLFKSHSRSNLRTEFLSAILWDIFLFAKRQQNKLIQNLFIFFLKKWNWNRVKIYNVLKEKEIWFTDTKEKFTPVILCEWNEKSKFFFSVTSTTVQK